MGGQGRDFVCPGHVCCLAALSGQAAPPEPGLDFCLHPKRAPREAWESRSERSQLTSFHRRLKAHLGIRVSSCHSPLLSQDLSDIVRWGTAIAPGVGQGRQGSHRLRLQLLQGITENLWVQVNGDLGLWEAGGGHCQEGPWGGCAAVSPVQWAQGSQPDPGLQGRKAHGYSMVPRPLSSLPAWVSTPAHPLTWTKRHWLLGLVGRLWYSLVIIFPTCADTEVVPCLNGGAQLGSSFCPQPPPTKWQHHQPGARTLPVTLLRKASGGLGMSGITWYRGTK